MGSLVDATYWGFFLLVYMLGDRQVRPKEEEPLLVCARHHSLLLRRRWLPGKRPIAANGTPAAP